MFHLIKLFCPFLLYFTQFELFYRLCNVLARIPHYILSYVILHVPLGLAGGFSFFFFSKEVAIFPAAVLPGLYFIFQQHLKQHTPTNPSFGFRRQACFLWTDRLLKQQNSQFVSGMVFTLYLFNLSGQIMPLTFITFIRLSENLAI